MLKRSVAVMLPQDGITAAMDFSKVLLLKERGGRAACGKNLQFWSRTYLLTSAAASPILYKDRCSTGILRVSEDLIGFFAYWV